MADRGAIRAAISNAYYGARNDGQTMEQAADRAADAVMGLIEDLRPLVESAQAAAMRNAGQRDDARNSVEAARLEGYQRGYEDHKEGRQNRPDGDHT